MALESINPATGVLTARFAEWAPEATAAVIGQVDAVWPAWRQTSFAQRSELMRRAAARSRCINSGQSCIAAKRILVEAAVHDSFVDRLKAHLAQLLVGDPCDMTTQIGPQAREELLEQLHRQVSSSVEKGAKLQLGGARLQRPGYFYPPTLLTEVKKGMPAYHEEVFGPVAAVIKVENAEQALAIANDTVFGLGGSVWTRDTAKGERLAAGIEAGAVFVNGLVKSDPRLPFGGIKTSGYGRELSHFGIQEFVNIQTVWMK